ncbi:uncharacterized protein LOC114538335 [Dendronephthya gigantea]|uniref:uncharacterized protein LOC114538335 n=1 Tax=Dendronephthya gigantea TaxID=151771 RepID=UPI001069B5C9|nr:uncharacterized protein LOC114538335 [Dendronephthya gigantea]
MVNDEDGRRIFGDFSLKLQGQLIPNNPLVKEKHGNWVATCTSQVKGRLETKTIVIPATAFDSRSKFLQELRGSFGSAILNLGGSVTTSTLADYYTYLKNDVTNSDRSLYKAQNLGFQPDGYCFLSKELHINHGELVRQGERIYFVDDEDIYRHGTELGRHLLDHHRLRSVCKSYIELSSHFGMNAVSFKLATAFVLNAIIKNAQRIRQSQYENEAKVENVIGMLFSDIAERNVGKSLTLETLAKAQGIFGDGHPLYCSGGDQTISGVSIKMLMSALVNTTLVCLVDDPRINATLSEFLLQLHGGLAQGSFRSGLAVPRGGILMSTNVQESERIYGRCIRIDYYKDGNFSFEDEKTLNEDLQILVTENKGFLVAWVVLFRKLWLDHKDEPLKKIRALLKTLVPEQDQDRWFKGAASILYTYALFHKVAGVQVDLKNAVQHVASCGQLRGAHKKLSFWERFRCSISDNLQNQEKPPLTWLNPCVTVCVADAFMPAIAVKLSETGQFTNVGNKEIKDHIGRALKKENNLAETVTFALGDAASLTDVRRRRNGLVRNARAYKVPKDLLGSDLCHFIEHACGLREDSPPRTSSQEEQNAAVDSSVIDETLTQLVTFFESITDTDYESEDRRPNDSEGAPIHELSPKTREKYDLRSPRGKRSYEQGIIDGIKIADRRQEIVAEREGIACHDNVNTQYNITATTPMPSTSSGESMENAKRPKRCLQFATGTIGVLDSQKKNSSAEDKEINNSCTLCGQDSPPSKKGGQMISWIDCDSCKGWFHMLCLKMRKKDAPETWKCRSCSVMSSIN